MKQSHTPGPWYVAYGIDVKAKDAYDRIIVQAIPSDAVDRTEAEANARLIAAAPDLLAALENLCECVLSPSLPAYQKARAAIAKAMGES